MSTYTKLRSGERGIRTALCTCMYCGGMLDRGESGRCLHCEVERNREREALGIGDLWCCDCRSLVEPQYDPGTGEAFPIEECPDCGSSALEPLSRAQKRAALTMDGAL